MRGYKIQSRKSNWHMRHTNYGQVKQVLLVNERSDSLHRSLTSPPVKPDQYLVLVAYVTVISSEHMEACDHNTVAILGSDNEPGPVALTKRPEILPCLQEINGNDTAPSTNCLSLCLGIRIRVHADLQRWVLNVDVCS